MAYHFEEGNSISPGHKDESSRMDLYGSHDDKQAKAADLSHKTTNYMTDIVNAHRKEGNIRAPGASEALAVRKKAYGACSRDIGTKIFRQKTRSIGFQKQNNRT